MALITYNPPEDRVVHTTQVDFVDRYRLGTPVHLVQGDDTLPIVAVELYKNGERYAAPTNAAGNIRLKKPITDAKHVYNPLLGVSSDRTVAYFEVSQQMATTDGEASAVIELQIGETRVNSSTMSIYFDVNPISNYAMRSSDEFKSLTSYVEDAQAAAESATASKTAAASSAAEAKASQTAAANSASEALKSQQAAKASETAAKSSQDAAAASQTAAKSSENAAASSASAAATSASEALKSQQAAKASQDAAAASQTAAKASETAAENWTNMSKSWAIGEGGPRDGQETDNSKYYAQQAGASAKIVSDNKASIDAVKNNLATLKTVEQNIADVNTVAAAETDISTVADNITAVQNVNANMTTVKGVNDNMASVKTVAGANANIKTVVDNLQAIKDAPDAATRAEAAADDADMSADIAVEAADRAQSIAQGAKGYYENPENLRASVPNGTAGDWAIVGSTDTIWVWDKETEDWKDSHQATDLSNYYTKNQADAENNKLLSQITQETDTKLANKLGKTEKAVSATNVQTTSSGPNLAVLEDTNNVWLQVSNISGSEVVDAVDIVIAKNDGHAWIHEHYNKADALSGLASQKIYTSAFPQPSVTGNAGTATKLATPRSLKTKLDSTAAVTFDGSGNQDAIPVTGILPVANGGTGNATGNAGTATKLATPRNINGVSFDGSKDITVYDNTKIPNTRFDIAGAARFITDNENIDTLGTGIVSVAASNTSSNAPFSGYELLTIRRSDDYAYQVAFSEDVTSSTIKIRHCSGGKWSNWWILSWGDVVPVASGGTGVKSLFGSGGLLYTLFPNNMASVDKTDIYVPLFRRSWGSDGGWIQCAQFLSAIGGQPKYKTATFTLEALRWTSTPSYSTGDNSLPIVTASNLVFVGPDFDSWEEWCNCGVRCNTQWNYALNFIANSRPTKDITVNIVAFD